MYHADYVAYDPDTGQVMDLQTAYIVSKTVFPEDHENVDAYALEERLADYGGMLVPVHEDAIAIVEQGLRTFVQMCSDIIISQNGELADEDQKAIDTLFLSWDDVLSSMLVSNVVSPEPALNEEE